MRFTIKYSSHIFRKVIYVVVFLMMAFIISWLYSTADDWAVNTSNLLLDAWYYLLKVIMILLFIGNLMLFYAYMKNSKYSGKRFTRNKKQKKQKKKNMENYRKLVEVQNVDITKLPQETQQRIAELTKIESLKNVDKRKRELNDLIYHEIVDWLAEQDNMMEEEQQKKRQQELAEKIAARRKKLEDAGFTLDNGKYSNKFKTQHFAENLLGDDSVTEEQLDSFIADAVAEDEVNMKKKEAQDAINERKRKAKEKADNFGMF